MLFIEVLAGLRELVFINTGLSGPSGRALAC